MPGPAARRWTDLIHALALLVASAIVFACWIACLNPHEFYGLILKNRNMFVDFVKLYACAKMVLAGAGGSVYDPAAQLDWMNRCAYPVHYSQLKYTQYVPFAFALMAPLAVLKLPPAYALWCIATVLFGLAGLLVLRHSARKPIGLLESGVLSLLFFSSVFSANTLMLGQTAWLMLAFIALFFACLLERRQIMCGILLALSCLKPQFLLLLCIPVLSRRMWKTVAAATLSGSILLILSGATIGLANLIHYPQILSHAEANLYGREYQLMISLRGLLDEFFGQETAFKLSAVPSIIGAAMIAWTWRRAGTKAEQVKAISLSVLIYLVFSPHAFLYDCLLLAIPTALDTARLSVALSHKAPDKKILALSLLLLPTLIWVPYLINQKMAIRLLLAAIAALLALKALEIRRGESVSS